MTLEDHAGDIVGKARKGLGVAPQQVTEAGGFTAESYAKFEQDGTYDDLPDLVKIGELRRYISLLRETAGGLFTRAPEEPDGILCHTDEAGLAKLIDKADTVMRF